jgi:hypothetical protein
MNGEDVPQWLDGTRDGELPLGTVTKREGHAVWNTVRLALCLQRVVVDPQLQRSVVQGVPVAPGEDERADSDGCE